MKLTTPYNLVFGQLPHSETRLADILINDNYDQKESFTTSTNILESNDNKSYDYLSNILNDYYNQMSLADDFESRLNLEDPIISDDYYLKDFLEKIIIVSSDLESCYTAQEKEKWKNQTKLGEFVNIQGRCPVKLFKKKPNQDSYQVTCKFGMLENWYPASELELLGTSDYPDLDIIPLNKTLSLRQASIKQNCTPAAQSLSSRKINQEFN
ncbi:64_t:CDS:2 [Gigaspora margarita]|uniref:64_t:CDS:1 n=1 Tax=Gigaspora margarita TaxID=4874 RepID=A0ABM8W730_GIGMA|nr:64_t:CDS:2 [Gigaspora margarita]